MAVFQSTRPMRGATSWTFKDVDTAEQFQSTRPMRGATSSHTRRTYKQLEFQSTRPMRGATALATAVHGRLTLFQSTRPMRGATMTHFPTFPPLMYFNPRAPCGARHGDLIDYNESQQFQSTRPMRGATMNLTAARELNKQISIHAPHAGRDICTGTGGCGPRNFNPRAPCGARLRGAAPAAHQSLFQSTRPMRGATSYDRAPGSSYV